MGAIQPIASSVWACVPGNIDRLADEREVPRHSLFEAAGLPRSTYYRKLKSPSKFKAIELARIAEALGTTFSELIGG